MRPACWNSRAATVTPGGGRRASWPGIPGSSGTRRPGRGHAPSAASAPGAGRARGARCRRPSGSPAAGRRGRSGAGASATPGFPPAPGGRRPPPAGAWCRMPGPWPRCRCCRCRGGGAGRPCPRSRRGRPRPSARRRGGPASRPSRFLFISPPRPVRLTHGASRVSRARRVRDAAKAGRGPPRAGPRAGGWRAREERVVRRPRGGSRATGVGGSAILSRPPAPEDRDGQS